MRPLAFSTLLPPPRCDTAPVFFPVLLRLSQFPPAATILSRSVPSTILSFSSLFSPRYFPPLRDFFTPFTKDNISQFFFFVSSSPGPPVDSVACGLVLFEANLSRHSQCILPCERLDSFCFCVDKRRSPSPISPVKRVTRQVEEALNGVEQLVLSAAMAPSPFTLPCPSLASFPLYYASVLPHPESLQGLRRRNGRVPHPP